MPTQGVRADTRRRLLDGLAQAIRDKGLRGTQITDIVRNARVSNRTFYECFPDKESCFTELIEEWMLAILEIVQAALDPEAPWDEQVDTTVETYLAALAENPAMTVTVTRELPALGARGAVLQENDIDRMATFLMEMTRGPAMRRAGVEPITLDTAVMLIGGIAEIVDRAAREGQPSESVGQTVKTVVKRVIGPSAHPR
ncbi:TetR/AcrR family transcriptional regulator [Streptomyces collinus]|uniref:TetR/AcrR family transcriptional regulator n=1 Tax=Streptomyces collinus TaxID=42684 RepID=UPI0036D1E1DA